MDDLQRSVELRRMQQQKRLGKGGKRNLWKKNINIKTYDRTPQSIVSSNFKKHLKGLDLSYNLIERYKDEVIAMDMSRFVNTEVLANTYVFMLRNNITTANDITPDKFTDEAIGYYVDRLIKSNIVVGKKYTESQIEAKKIAFKQEIFRYTVMIISHQQSRQVN